MFGSSGRVAPVHMLSSLGSLSPPPSYNNQKQQQQEASPFSFSAANHQHGAYKQKPTASSSQESAVTISMDLLQYMSESMVVAWTPKPGCSQQPHSGTAHAVVPDTCASSSSTDSDQMVPAACSPASPSSRSSSAALEPAASRSGSVEYHPEFVYQCYFGDPSSPANQQQQRPKAMSPFAAFSTFPGFSL